MSKPAHQVTLAVHGKIGTKVYQRVRKGLGNIETRGRYDLQLRALGTRTDAQSPAQLALRARLADATAAYQALDQQQRDVWRDRASGQRLTGYNLFVAWYCDTHPIGP